jgi:hypothetical protein
LNAADKDGKRPIDYINWGPAIDDLSQTTDEEHYKLSNLPPLLRLTNDLRTIPAPWRLLAYAFLGRHEELQQCVDCQLLMQQPTFRKGAILMALCSLSEATLQACMENYQLCEADYKMYGAWIKGHSPFGHYIEILGWFIKHGKISKNAVQLIMHNQPLPLWQLEKFIQMTGSSYEEILPLWNGSFDRETFRMTLSFLRTIDRDKWQKAKYMTFEPIGREEFHKILAEVPNIFWLPKLFDWALVSALNSDDPKWVFTLTKVQEVLLKENVCSPEDFWETFRHMRLNQKECRNPCFLPDDAYRSILNKLQMPLKDMNYLPTDFFTPNLRVEREWILAVTKDVEDVDWTGRIENMLNDYKRADLECMRDCLDRMIRDPEKLTAIRNRTDFVIEALKRWE